MLRHRKFKNGALVRSDGSALYNLACVADDANMGITHVIRGDDHMDNTKLQMSLFSPAIMNKPSIKYIHHSQMVGPGNEKISKRRTHNSTDFTIFSLYMAGMYPMPILSYLATAGTSTDIKLYSSMDEMIEDFDIDKFGKSPIVVDIDRLWKLNTEYMRTLPYKKVKNDEFLSGGAIPKCMRKDFWKLCRGNIRTLKQLSTFSRRVTNAVRNINRHGYEKMLEENGGKVDQNLRIKMTGYKSGPPLDDLVAFAKK